MKIRSLAVAALLTCCVIASSVAGGTLYTLDGSFVLPRADTGWDYIKKESAGSRLLMARDADRLTVFDVA